MLAVRLGSSSGVQQTYPSSGANQRVVTTDQWQSSPPSAAQPLTFTSLVLPAPGTEPGAAPALLDQVTSRGITVSLADAARVAPIVQFHPKEAAYPCSAAHLLKGSKLVDEAGNVLAVNPTPAQLAQHRDASNRLLVDPAMYSGEGEEHERVRAPMYLSVQVPPDASYVDLNYIFLFAYQPAQAARVLVPKSDFNCTLPHFGEHEGDVEGVTVRMSPDLKTIWHVRYEAHGHERWFSGEDVDLEDGHPLVRCSLNAHATYNNRGKKDLDWEVNTRFKALGFGVEFIDILSNQGPRWMPFETLDGVSKPNGQLVFVGLQEDGSPINNQAWTAFSGRIGKRCENVYSSADGIDQPLSKLQRRYVNMIARAAVKAGAVKQHYRDSNGTPGFGERPWIRLEP